MQAEAASSNIFRFNISALNLNCIVQLHFSTISMIKFTEVQRHCNEKHMGLYKVTCVKHRLSPQTT